MKTCQDCTRINPDDTIFCNHCGGADLVEVSDELPFKNPVA